MCRSTDNSLIVRDLHGSGALVLVRLGVNAARLTTCDKMKEEVAGVLLARQGRSAALGDSSGPAPMDIVWIGCTGKGKGDKGKRDGKGKDKSADKGGGSKGDRSEKKCCWWGAQGGICKAIATSRRNTREARGGVNMVEDGMEEGETLAVYWVLAIVSES